MVDMLGREIEKGDYVLIDFEVCKVVKSYSSKLMLVGKSLWGNSEHRTFGTGMNEKVLKLNDFDPSVIQTKLDVADLELLDRYVEPSAATKSPEERARINAENRQKNALKKETKIGSLIKDGNYQWHMYIGKHRKQITPMHGQIIEEDNTLYHTYVNLGSAYSASDARQIRDRVMDLTRTWYSSYDITYTKGLKQPTAIDNTYNHTLIDFFKSDSVPENSSAYMRENREKINNMLSE